MYSNISLNTIHTSYNVLLIVYVHRIVNIWLFSVPTRQPQYILITIWLSFCLPSDYYSDQVRIDARALIETRWKAGPCTHPPQPKKHTHTHTHTKRDKNMWLTLDFWNQWDSVFFCSYQSLLPPSWCTGWRSFPENGHRTVFHHLTKTSHVHKQTKSP